VPRLISLIIPAYNEESRIGASIQSAIDYFADKDYEVEILVVDDGSKDNTIEVVSGFPHVQLLAQPQNMGKGAAVRRGMLEASGEIRVFTDADFSTPIHEIEKLLSTIDSGYDICIGSRAVDRSLVKEHQPFYREYMGRTFNYIVQLLVIRGIKDTQCGFKGFTKKAAEIVFREAKIDGFSFDVEALYIAKINNLKIAEVPVEWYNDDRSTVHPIRDSIKMFYEILRIRSMH
jgi:dolichyl-phosphate beta-glucosyltransferase